MGRVFLDTSFILALVRPADENHSAAQRLQAVLPEAAYLSDHVLDETVTFLGKNKEQDIAYEVGRRLLGSKNIEVVVSRPDHLVESLEVFRKYSGFSFCDALSVVLMKDYNIRKIASFDSDFDRVPWIERID